MVIRTLTPEHRCMLAPARVRACLSWGPIVWVLLHCSQVPHEWPGVQRPNGLWTTYSACDTTSLFIIATYTVKTRAGARARSRRASVSDLTAVAMVDALMPSIQRAVGYILSHVDSRGLFVDSPGTRSQVAQGPSVAACALGM